MRAEEAALGLAHKEFYPDFEVMGAYDTFWQERELQWQIGVRMNLPVCTGRRHGAVAEAEAKIAQRRAELAKQADQVNYQVQEAFEKARQGEGSVALYAKKILPAAKANVEAAQTAYVTGKIPFLSLIEAQRNQVSLRERYYETVAEYFRRRATLERAVAGPLETSSVPEPAPMTPGNAGVRPLRAWLDATSPPCCRRIPLCREPRRWRFRRTVPGPHGRWPVSGRNRREPALPTAKIRVLSALAPVSRPVRSCRGP